MKFVGVVKYWDLGRNNSKGDIEIQSDNEDDFNNQILKEFSKHLMSKDISFDGGKIFVGFRTVGYYTFVGKENG